VNKSIRELIEKDIPFFNSVRNECAQFLHTPVTYTLQQSYEWFSTNTNPFFIYEIDSRPIGYFRTSNWSSLGCYVGLDIHKDYRGKKLAVEAYELFFKFLDKEYGLEIFQLEVMDFNTRAINLYEKLGFKKIDSYITDNGTSIKMQYNYGKNK